MPGSRPVSSIPLARSVAVVPFVEFLDRGGASTRRHLRDTRIDPEIFQSPESLIALQQAAWFIDRAGRQEGLEDFGLQVGAAASVLDLGLFGEVLAQSLTLRDLIGKLIRWAPKLNSGIGIELKDRGEDSVEVRLHERITESRRHADDFCLMLILDAVRLALGAEWRPSEVVLQEQSRRFASRYEIFSEARCLANDHFAAVRLPLSALDRPLRRRLDTRRDDLEDAMERTSPSENFEQSLATVVESILGLEPPTIETAAEIASVSVRTLQRRLADCGTTYEMILDRIRFEGSLKFLQDGDKKLREVAHRLGYSDPANFTRAFRRWTGSSPNVYRRKYLAVV